MTRTIRGILARFILFVFTVHAAFAAPPGSAREAKLERQVNELTLRLERVEKLLAASTAATRAVTSSTRDEAAQALSRRVAETERVQQMDAKTNPKVVVGPPPKGASVSSADGKYKVRFGTREHIAYQQQHFNRAEDKGTFQVRMAKLYADGQLGSKATEFRIQLELAGPAAATRLDDAWVQQNFAQGLHARAGQFKTPVSRQWINTKGEMTFVDRSMATQVFAATSPGGTITAGDFASLATHGIGRNMGLELWGDLGESALVRYYAGILNGSGQNVRNDNTGMLYVSRLELQPFGDVSYGEGAYARPDHPILALDAGISVDKRSDRFDIDGKAGITLADREDRTLTDLGASFKWDRFSAQGEYFRQWTDPYGPKLVGVGSNGYYWQVGWLLVPNRWELSWRDSGVDPDRAAAGNDLREEGPGLNYYIGGHSQKLTGDVMRVTDQANNKNDQTRGRLQYQFTF